MSAPTLSQDASIKRLRRYVVFYCIFVPIIGGAVGFVGGGIVCLMFWKVFTPLQTEMSLAGMTGLGVFLSAILLIQKLRAVRILICSLREEKRKGVSGMLYPKKS
jgi:hypothetical protein